MAVEYDARLVTGTIRVERVGPRGDQRVYSWEGGPLAAVAAGDTWNDFYDAIVSGSLPWIVEIAGEDRARRQVIVRRVRNKDSL